MRKGTSREQRNGTVSCFETHTFTCTKKTGWSVETTLGKEYRENGFFLGAFNPWKVSTRCLVTADLRRHYTVLWYTYPFSSWTLKQLSWCFPMLSILLIDTLFYEAGEMLGLQLNKIKCIDKINSFATVTHSNFTRSKKLHQHKSSKVAVNQVHMQSGKHNSF